jgi:hypothetical protein
MDVPRLKNLYLAVASKTDPNPFQEILDIFESFNSISHAQKVADVPVPASEPKTVGVT